MKISRSSKSFNFFSKKSSTASIENSLVIVKKSFKRLLNYRHFSHLIYYKCSAYIYIIFNIACYLKDIQPTIEHHRNTQSSNAIDLNSINQHNSPNVNLPVISGDTHTLVC